LAENRGQLLPVYILADESASMRSYESELNDGLTSLIETLRSEPMIAAKIRLSVIGFSDNVAARMVLADLRSLETVPRLQIRGSTNYRAAFDDLLKRIPGDVSTLKQAGFSVHRPAVFFLSDGQPDDGRWRNPHRRLTDRLVTAAAPNIIAFGIGAVQSKTILEVATQPAFAFVAIPGSNVGKAISKFFLALTASVIQSGQSLASTAPQLVVEHPEGFRLAIDVV
jgi:uncharacterized protein YegL